MTTTTLARKARFYLSQLQFLEISRCMYEPETPERDDLERRIDSARALCMDAEKPLNDAGWHLGRDGSLGRIVEISESAGGVDLSGHRDPSSPTTSRVAPPVRTRGNHLPSVAA